MMPAQQQGQQVAPSTRPMGLDLQMYIAKGLELISSPQTRQSVLVMLKNGRPVEALAATLVVIMQRLDAAARKKGIETEDVVKIFGAHELAVELAKVGQAARIMNLDEDHVELALSVAVQDYIKGEVAAGRINPGKLQEKLRTGMAQLSPEKRQEAKAAIEKLQLTAKKYSSGGQ